MKLKPDDSYGDWYWVGAPESDDLSPEAQLLKEHRYKIEIHGGIVDKDADYSYDDWALCELKGKFYLLSTSGCSCPSPSETWRVEIGPATIPAIRKKLKSGDYDGYTVPGRQMDEFMELLDEVEKKVKRRKKLH